MTGLVRFRRFGKYDGPSRYREWMKLEDPSIFPVYRKIFYERVLTINQGGK